MEMEKDTALKNQTPEVINQDAEGKVISEAFPVSSRTKRDQRKTSVIYTLIAALLHIVAFVPVIAAPVVLAIKCYQLAPYYTFWHFIGVIIAVVFAIIYAVVVLCVTRKKSKSNIAMQTVKVAITFTCLTTGFGLILSYALPDIIEMATQKTLFAEDVYYMGEAQAERNLKLDRDFIMYNVLNGNLNDHSDAEHGDYSYQTLSKRQETAGGLLTGYDNSEINETFNAYVGRYTVETLETQVLDVMEKNNPRKFELYNFVYNSYVLNDFDYALYNNIERRAFALSVVDYVYTHANYEKLLKEGFGNKRIKKLFDVNFDSFNHDGYQTFDDALLLYAQIGRMTVPVVLRLILNEGWSYSDSVINSEGKLEYYEDTNFLYELYDKAEQEAFEEAGGEYKYTGTLMNTAGEEYQEQYGFNDKGWMVFKNGIIKRPIDWLVLDMDGNAMSIATVDLYGLLDGLLPGVELGDIINDLLPKIGKIFDAAGGLLREDVPDLIKFVTGGANLNVNICMNDENQLAIAISPMNVAYGMPGYANASWIQSNNLLMAVINLLGVRNWFSLFGALGVVLVIAAGVMRECARKTRLRTAVSRDRIARAKTAQRIADGELDPEVLDEHYELASELTAEDVARLEKAQQNRSDSGAEYAKGKRKRNKKQDYYDDYADENAGLDELDDLNDDGVDLGGQQPKSKRKG